MEFLKSFLIFFVIDTIFIQLFSKKLWMKNVKNVSNQDLVVKPIYAILSYLCIALGIFFVHKNLSYNWINGIFLGLAIYGTYNFTNLAIFKNYDLYTGILDTVLGTLSISLTLYILEKI